MMQWRPHGLFLNNFQLSELELEISDICVLT